MAISKDNKTKSNQPDDKPLCDDKPTGSPSNDRFEAETAHHDVADPHPGGKPED